MQSIGGDTIDQNMLLLPSAGAGMTPSVSRQDSAGNPLTTADIHVQGDPQEG